MPFALWGGLMTSRARPLQAGGAVPDGFSRDTPEVLKGYMANFDPTFVEEVRPDGGWRWRRSP